MMVTGLQFALLGGILLAGGAVLLVWRFLPAHPDLGDVLVRLAPDTSRPGIDADPVDESTTDRLGRWGMRTLPADVWGPIPTQELALLRIPVARFYGEKILFAVAGLLIAPLLSVFLTVLGWQLPVLVPVGGTLVLAVVMWFLPNYNVRDDAKRARVEFARALGAYTDLVALERNAGSGPRRRWRSPPRWVTRGCSAGCGKNSRSRTGRGKRPGMRCSGSRTNWACRN